MPWPKTGAANYNAELGLYNSRDSSSFVPDKGLAQPSHEVLINKRVHFICYWYLKKLIYQNVFPFPSHFPLNARNLILT